jgi:hypothetical protein
MVLTTIGRNTKKINYKRLTRPAGNSWTLVLTGLILAAPVFSQTVLQKNWIHAGYVAAEPLAPDAFQKNWHTGRGVAVEYQSFLSQHLSFFAGLEYLSFGLNDPILAEEYNPSQNGMFFFSFSDGHFRSGVFQVGLRLFLSDASYPLVLLVQAAGSLVLMDQEKMTKYQYLTRDGSLISTTSDVLGKSETAPGVQVGAGMRIRIAKSMRLLLLAEGHGVFSRDRSENPDGKVVQLSRAQGKSTFFLAFRSGLEYSLR